MLSEVEMPGFLWWNKGFKDQGSVHVEWIDYVSLENSLD